MAKPKALVRKRSKNAFVPEVHIIFDKKHFESLKMSLLIRNRAKHDTRSEMRNAFEKHLDICMENRVRSVYSRLHILIFHLPPHFVRLRAISTGK